MEYKKGWEVELYIQKIHQKEGSIAELQFGVKFAELEFGDTKKAHRMAGGLFACKLGFEKIDVFQNIHIYLKKPQTQPNANAYIYK